MACWNAFYEELPTRRDRLREKLSSENREQHATVRTQHPCIQYQTLTAEIVRDTPP
jgi:hypothetical protein